MQTICPVGDVATPGVDALAIDKERHPTFFQWLFERPGEQVFFDHSVTKGGLPLGKAL